VYVLLSFPEDQTQVVPAISTRLEFPPEVELDAQPTTTTPIISNALIIPIVKTLFLISKLL
jgi:hypothetical protein